MRDRYLCSMHTVWGMQWWTGLWNRGGILFDSLSAILDIFIPSIGWDPKTGHQSTKREHVTFCSLLPGWSKEVASCCSGHSLYPTLPVSSAADEQLCTCCWYERWCFHLEMTSLPGEPPNLAYPLRPASIEQPRELKPGVSWYVRSASY